MITVLGASGFIGRALTGYLRRQGEVVFAPERNYLPEPGRSLGHLIYAIGLTADFRTRPLETVDAHVCHLTRFLAGCDYQTFTYLSSTRVYAGAASTSETAPLSVIPSNPDQLYNITKLAGEAACHALAGCRARVVRLSNVIGFDETSQNFLFTLLRSAIADKHLNMATAEQSEKDYILIEDILFLIHKICSSGRAATYNAACGVNVSNKDLALAIAGHTGCRVSWQPDAPVIRFPAIDTRLINQEFGFKPARLLDSLQTIIGHFRKGAAHENHV